MPPRTLALSRNGFATLMRIGYALGMVGVVALAMLVVFALSAFTSTTGSDMLIFFLMLSPLVAIAGYVTWLTLRPIRLLVHADALEIRHPRMLRRPLVIPRANVRAVHVDDGRAAGAARFPTGDDAEPFLWTQRIVSVRNRRRPLIGDGVMPNLAIELVSATTIEEGRNAWVAGCMRGEPDPPSSKEPVTHVMLTVEDLAAAEEALGSWGIRRPGPTPVLAPELQARQRQEADMLVIALATMAPVPFYVLGFWQIVPVHMALIVFTVARMAMRWRSELAAARDVAASQPPERRAAAAAAAEANWGPPPVG